VALLWLLVRKYFGLFAATGAGLALALSPISVAVNRLDLPEPMLILALLGAAACVIRSLEAKRWWAWTIAAGVLVGIAFNTKMLAAWIPGPAMALAIVVAYPQLRARATLVRVAAQLAILAVATVAVSASWMLVVDTIPSSDRPYVGGSTDNTVQNLVVDYNGVGRVEGETVGPGGRPTNAAPPRQTVAGPRAAINGPGGIIAGQPGRWRMLDDTNGPQVAWFIPLALFGAPLALWRWRKDPVRRAAVVLFAGWVLLFGGVFSYAQGIYHSYYTSALVPGIAALVGMVLVAGVDLARSDRRWLLALFPPVALTAWLQFDLASRFPNYLDSAPMLGLGVLLGGVLAVAMLALARSRVGVTPGLAVVLAGLLVTPGAWAYNEATQTSLNTTLPQAGPRQGAAGRSFGSQAFDSGVSSLAAWLEANGTSERWDLAVSSAQNASTLIAEYNLSVMAIGGFSGADPTLSVDDFAARVASGDVRYVLATQGGGVLPNLPFNRGTSPGAGGFDGGAPRGTDGAGRNPPQPGGQTFGGPGQIPAAPQGANRQQPTLPLSQTKGANAVMSAVRSVCKPVTGSAAPAGYSGSLYDCSGLAAELRAF